MNTHETGSRVRPSGLRTRDGEGSGGRSEFRWRSAHHLPCIFSSTSALGRREERSSCWESQSAARDGRGMPPVAVGSRRPAADESRT
eukprot:814885-Prymnesium_polylepis.1